NSRCLHLMRCRPSASTLFFISCSCHTDCYQPGVSLPPSPIPVSTWWNTPQRTWQVSSRRVPNPDAPGVSPAAPPAFSPTPGELPAFTDSPTTCPQESLTLHSPRCLRISRHSSQLIPPHSSLILF